MIKIVSVLISSLLPPFLVVGKSPLKLGPFLGLNLFYLEFAEVILLTVLLPFPFNPLFSVLGLLLDDLPRFDLSIAIPIKCFVLFAVCFVVVVADLITDHLVLVLKLPLALLQLIASIEGGSEHLLLVVLDPLLNLNFVVVINCRGIARGSFVVFEPRHSTTARVIRLRHSQVVRVVAMLNLEALLNLMRLLIKLLKLLLAICLFLLILGPLPLLHSVHLLALCLLAPLKLLPLILEGLLPLPVLLCRGHSEYHFSLIL